MLEADLRHVAIHAGHGGNHGHAHERVGEIVGALARNIETAGLLPEPMRIGRLGQAAFVFRQALQHDRQRRGQLEARRLARANLLHFSWNLVDFGVTALHHAQVVVHHALALLAELVVELVFDRLEQRFLIQAGALLYARGMEERALEGVALHAQLQIGVGGFLARDAERIQVKDMDVVVGDELLRVHREGGPQRGGIRQVALDDEHAALFQARHRVGMQEDLRIGRQHDIDLGVFAVDADWFRRGGQVVGGGLPLFLGAVFRIRLDVPAEQFEQCHRQVLAGGHRAPATDRVHAHCDGALRHQVGVFRTFQRQFLDLRIRREDVLLMDFLLRVGSLIADEVDRQIEEFSMRAVRQHVFNRGNQTFRLQIARAQAIAAGIQARHVRHLGIAGVAGIRLAASGLVVFHRAVFQAFADRGAHFTHQRQVFRQRLVGTFQHRDTLLAFQNLTQQVTREGAETGQVDDADFQLAVVAQPVGDGFRLHAHGAHAENDVIGVGAAVGIDATVVAAGQFAVFGHALIQQRRDVLEEIRTLRGGSLHVRVLVGDGAGSHRRINVPDRRDTAAHRPIDDFLRRRRRSDHVVRAAEEFGDQFLLRHQHRLDQVCGEEAVHRHHRRRQTEFSGLARDQVEVGGLLRALAEHLDEAGIVGAVVIVMAAMHIQRRLGDRTATQVEHIGQALADRAIERFVHERQALRGSEVDRTQAGHRHAGGNAGGGVFGFGFQEDQRPTGHVDVAGGDRLGPVLAHLGGRRDRVGAGGVGGFALDQNHGGVAIDGIAHAGVFDCPGFRPGCGFSTQCRLDQVHVAEKFAEGILDHVNSLLLRKTPG